jgi:signal transduction histidine kinase
MGFLLLIAFNLAHRFSYSSGHHFKTFDVVWLVSLLVIIYGLIFSLKEKNKEICFFYPRSLHVFTGAIFITFSTSLIVLFIFIDFVVSSIEMNNVGSYNILPQNIPSVLIFAYSLSLLVSKIVSNYLACPLENIAKKIDIINENSFSDHNIKESRLKIYEIDKLDKFILTTITQLHAANRVKSDFLMNMSHDFRTPASGVYHLSKSVHNRIDNPQLKKLQGLVVNSSEQLMNFLEDILDYSRLDNNKVTIDSTQFSIEVLINEIIELVSAKSEEKSLKIYSSFLNDLSTYVGDRLIIQRTILNIVSNAIKFTHVGSVTIRAEKINDWVVIGDFQDSCRVK